MEHEEQNNELPLAEPQEVFTAIPQARGTSGGTRWLGLGWDLIKERFWLWIGVIIVYFLINLIISGILGLIPLIGSIISPFVSAILATGILAIAHQQYETQRMDMDNLFAGFQNKKYVSIMGAYGISFLIILAGVILAVVVSSANIMMIMEAIAYDYSDEYIGELVLANLGSMGFFGIIISVFALLSSAVYWFAPALILFNDYKAFDAVKASFAAVKTNIAGGIVFFILLFVIIAISVIPFGLGLLITIPLSYTAMYASYRDIFYHHNISSDNSNNDSGLKNSNINNTQKTIESNIGKLVS